MKALIVVSHPNPESLTHSVARRIGEGVSADGSGNTAQIADLFAEGFDPRFNRDDLIYFKVEGPAPEDVAKEQSRIDAADALILVYPIYWWSLPGLLKGWIDRVFANGWAYGTGPDGKVLKKLGHLPVHLIGVGGADAGTMERHGYFTAMKTQIDHGIFNYCGAPVRSSELMLESDTNNPLPHLEAAHAIGGRIFDGRGSNSLG